MRMFNPDGSEDFCGNGLRCAAIHARKIGWVGDRFDIDHFGITVPTRIESNETVETVIGSASYLPQAIPANLDPSMDTVVWMGPTESGETLSLVGSALTTGSAHLVLRVDELPDDELFFRVSPTLETDPRFPERISVIWSKAISLDRLSIRIWERGVGETAGCGTGSSAAAVETFRLRGFGGSIAVENPGGVALVSADSWDSPITVEAPAYEVFSGVLAI